MKMVKEEQWSKRGAASYYGVPEKTLRRHLKEGSSLKSVGGQQALSPEVEQVLTDILNEMAKWNHPVGALETKIMVKTILDNQNMKIKSFPNNLPGDKWLTGFKNRNRISTRTATNIKRARSAMSSTVINEFFDNSCHFIEDTLW